MPNVSFHNCIYLTLRWRDSVLLSNDIENWILYMKDFILNTCHGPSEKNSFIVKSSSKLI